MLAARLVEGWACWAILEIFYGGVTVDPWLIRINFLAYTVANCVLLIPQRRQAMSSPVVWIDIIVNLLPMAIAAHWSGGIYSPILAVFVIKIGNYGLIYSVETGIQSLIATAAFATALWLFEGTGLGSSVVIDDVPPLVRQQLSLIFGGLLFVVGCFGALRFFRELADREARLAKALAEQERLYLQSLKDQEHLRQLSRRVVQVGETTMQRVSHELHDDLGQALTAVKMDLGRIDRQLPPDSHLHGQIQETREQVSHVLQSVRNLSQLLRPAVLDDLGLIPAMQSYVSRFAERTGVAVALSAPAAEPRFHQHIEVALYRVMQEALTNVARHAAAHRVDVRLTIDDGTAVLRVIDDGRGFDVRSYLLDSTPKHGMGVLGMRERAEVYGGDLKIESAPGAGTEVELRIPMTPMVGATEGTDYVEDQRLAR